MNSKPLAHSEGDPYVRHVRSVHDGARERAMGLLRHAIDPPGGFLESVSAAAAFHDLGKLDPDNQIAFKKGRNAKLKWDHIDAGVAHLSVLQDWMAAWLVRAHHSPGLPEKEEHFNRDGVGRRLRGRRNDGEEIERHEEQIERTNQLLEDFLKIHEKEGAPEYSGKRKPLHGLAMRLALSCLVDADHSDTACFYDGHPLNETPEPRWHERLEALCRYVTNLQLGATEEERSRNRRRKAFFEACFESEISDPMVSCEGAVGLGKTTAVTAYLIRRAKHENLRKLIIIAPYTNILRQTAIILRKALVLPGEQPDLVVMEHHHRADFHHASDRDLAVLWKAPIILTTAVSFFETLSACDPATLRKLHVVPGSAIFIDEAHTTLPTKLWPQNWLWLCELTEKWGCRIVLASGSLARFWENPAIINPPVSLPELLPKELANNVLVAESKRVHYAKPPSDKALCIKELAGYVEGSPGPRLVILNTVQNAAVVAKAMKDSESDVLHLSTALTPGDRDKIIDKVKDRLGKDDDRSWTLVATSCVEAGVDMSFRTAFRERFAVASLVQVGGRVNRHGEYDREGGGVVFDFALADEGITRHKSAEISADVLRDLMKTDKLNQFSPADLVTMAMQKEMAIRGGFGADPLLKAELGRNYPMVKVHGRVIDADTRLVVVDKDLKAQITNHGKINFNDLLRGSVQLWATKIDRLGLCTFPGRNDLYYWLHDYDPDFLGYMAGVLRIKSFMNDPEARIL